MNRLRSKIFILILLLITIISLSTVKADTLPSVFRDGYFDIPLTVYWYDYGNIFGERPEQIDLSFKGETTGKITTATLTKNDCSNITDDTWEATLRVYVTDNDSISNDKYFELYDVGGFSSNLYFCRLDYSRGYYIEQGSLREATGSIIFVADVSRRFYFNAEWNDDNDRDGIRPSLLNYILTNPDDANDENHELEIELGEHSYSYFNYSQENWKGTLFGSIYPHDSNGDPILSKKTRYLIEPLDNLAAYQYNLDVDDNIYTLSYTYEPEKLDYDISTSVTWEDNENLVIPDKISVTLYSEHEEYKTVEIKTSDNWKYIFTDLYKYENKGQEVSYKLSVQNMKGIEFEVSGDQENGFSILGKYKEEPTEPEPVEYTILEGANQTYSKGNDLVIKANGDISKFQKLLVDGEVLDTSNYTIQSGSTIATLSSSYLDTLSVGEHTLTFVYEDGTIDTIFKIAEIKDNSSENVNSTIDNTNEKTKSSNVKTGDNIGIFIISFVLALAGIVIVRLKIKK